MNNTQDYSKLRKQFYWLAYLTSYVFPLTYFIVKLGITKEKTTLIMPVVLIMVLAVVKLGIDLPTWVSTWEPSFKKGLVKALPKLFMFLMLITLGVAFKYILTERIDYAFKAYFETVFVLFGGMAVGSIFDAFHLKYKELYLMSKGYVLGTINK